jgi:hypothetical protein
MERRSGREWATVVLLPLVWVLAAPTVLPLASAIYLAIRADLTRSG